MTNVFNKIIEDYIQKLLFKNKYLSYEYDKYLYNLKIDIKEQTTCFLHKLVNNSKTPYDVKHIAIKELEEKLEGVHNVVYQLLGGLFNKHTQTRILHTHLSYLLPNERLYKKEYDLLVNPKEEIVNVIKETNKEIVEPTTTRYNLRKRN